MRIRVFSFSLATSLLLLIFSFSVFSLFLDQNFSDPRSAVQSSPPVMATSDSINASVSSLLSDSFSYFPGTYLSTAYTSTVQTVESVLTSNNAIHSSTGINANAFILLQYSLIPRFNASGTLQNDYYFSFVDSSGYPAYPFTTRYSSVGLYSTVKDLGYYFYINNNRISSDSPLLLSPDSLYYGVVTGDFSSGSTATCYFSYFLHCDSNFLHSASLLSYSLFTVQTTSLVESLPYLDISFVSLGSTFIVLRYTDTANHNFDFVFVTPHRTSLLPSSFTYYTNIYDNNEYSEGYTTGFELGQSQGYTQGLNVGTQDGYTQGFSVGRSQGYDTGFNAGVASRTDYSFASLFTSMADTFVNAFNNLFSFSVFGIDIKAFILSMLSLSIVFIVLRFVV